jgi:YesN/AraC family two-component response regulator
MHRGSAAPSVVPATLTVEVAGTAYRWVGTLVLEESAGDVPPVVRRAMDYIDHHISDPGLSLANVAEAIPVSKCYLARRFKEACGMTCNTYIETRRANRVGAQV